MESLKLRVGSSRAEWEQQGPLMAFSLEGGFLSKRLNVEKLWAVPLDLF